MIFSHSNSFTPLEIDMWLHFWRCRNERRWRRSGKFLVYNCEAAFWTQEMFPRLLGVKCSVSPWSVFTINRLLVVILGMTHSSTCPPNVQVHHCTWLRFTRPSAELVMQVTNTGMRRPGYEATPPVTQPHFPVLFIANSAPRYLTLVTVLDLFIATSAPRYLTLVTVLDLFIALVEFSFPSAE